MRPSLRRKAGSRASRCGFSLLGGRRVGPPLISVRCRLGGLAGRLAVMLLPFFAALVLWRPLSRSGQLLAIFRASYVITCVCFVVALAQRSTWRLRTQAAWVGGGLALLVARLLSPFLNPLPLLGPWRGGDLLFAYDGGVGTWVWILVYATGYLVSGRIYGTGRRGLSILFAATWAFGTMMLLSNSAGGGDELGARWRT
jgi:hypothetical protein